MYCSPPAPRHTNSFILRSATKVWDLQVMATEVPQTQDHVWQHGLLLP